jgi:hypothetical protein
MLNKNRISRAGMQGGGEGMRWRKKYVQGYEWTIGESPLMLQIVKEGKMVSTAGE